MRRALLLAICLLSCAARTLADDVYVSNLSGDDRFDGRSTQKSSDYGGPVRTFAKALRVAGPDDRIVIENTGMPYYEGISLEGPWHSGRPGTPFVRRSAGGLAQRAPCDTSDTDPLRTQRCASGVG
jgi:hypothetical protein